MTIKVLDVGNVERTISVIKVLDVGNVERTLAFIRVLDVGNVVREVYTAGGGAVGATITPTSIGYRDQESYSRSANFVASAPGATGFTWGVLSGPGEVAVGGSTANATLTIYNDGSTPPIVATFFCDVAVGGSTKRATCTLRLNPVLNTGPGGGGGVPQQ